MRDEEKEWQAKRLLSRVAWLLKTMDIPFLFAIQQEDYSLHMQYHFSDDTVSELTVAGYEFGLEDLYENTITSEPVIGATTASGDAGQK